MILERINNPGDIKEIHPEEYALLAYEIRKFIIEKVSNTGGHLASNLGVVELTMAMHLTFDLPKDKIIWDVGHQSYIHKLLTGRKNEFDTLRQFEGMSGFPKTHESNCDAFNTGHSSTSLSVGLGMAFARDILNGDENIISVIGDGALTGGMALEALNNISNYKGKFITVINDNKMSISENRGGVSNLLSNVRVNESYHEFKEGVVNNLNRMKNGEKLVSQLRKTKDDIRHLVMPTSIFESMGIKYLGPIDGHDMNKLLKAFTIAKRSTRPIVIHVVTKKGYGYRPAEKNPEKFHGVGAFDIATGNVVSADGVSYTGVFSKKLCELAKNDSRIVAITASMPEGTGLKTFSKLYKNRYFDVGIAEGHAVTFAAGLASGGLKPVVAIYSSFLQRAYDQILHDVCLNNLPVVFAIDRSGLVGADGETHQGIYDISYLSIIPNLTVLAPKNKKELEDMLEYAFSLNSPVAIKYPRGSALDSYEAYNEPLEYGKSEFVIRGKDVALISVGNMFDTSMNVYEKLKALGYNISVINARSISPIDTNMISEISANHKLIVTLEENVYSGGYGQAVSAYISQNNCKCKVINISLPDKYVEHGTCNILRDKYGLDSVSIVTRIINTLNE